MYIARNLEKTLGEHLSALEKGRKIITLLGPRQSGKTTLARKVFSDLKYINLEDPEIREFAIHDPKGLFRQYGTRLILDEVQRVPELLSWVQVLYDEIDSKCFFVLTGSHNPSLSQGISQSLAGRTQIYTVLPLSFREIFRVRPELKKETWFECALLGGYPKIFSEDLAPQEWLRDYYLTYVEKDLRSISKIEKLDEFQRFIQLLAGRSGQLLNLSQLGSEAGITQPTAQAWLSVLKATYICFGVQPHFRNFNKRVTKSPKIYFNDTGLLCYLLKIRNVDTLRSHPLAGFIFENLIVSEIVKSMPVATSDLYFWRDQGHEVDLVVDEGGFLVPIEIKSTQTFRPELITQILYLNKIQKRDISGKVIFGGTESLIFQGVDVIPWFMAGDLLTNLNL